MSISVLADWLTFRRPVVVVVVVAVALVDVKSVAEVLYRRHRRS
jgi:hypothetical protein